MCGLEFGKWVILAAMGMVFSHLGGAVYAADPPESQIEVVSAGEADAELTARVRQVVADSVELHGVALKLTVKGLEVTLEGTVPSEEHKSSLIDAVRSADERIEIQDLLTVDGTEQEDAKEPIDKMEDLSVQKVELISPQRLYRLKQSPRLRCLRFSCWR